MTFATRTLAVLALAAPLLAPALPASALAGVTFSRTDTDRNGYVTYDEAHRVVPTLARVHFRKSDMDDDGVLSKGEFAGFSAFLDVMYDDR